VKKTTISAEGDFIHNFRSHTENSARTAQTEENTSPVRTKKKNYKL